MIGAKYRAYWIFVKKQILNMLFMLYYFLIFNKISFKSIPSRNINNLIKFFSYLLLNDLIFLILEPFLKIGEIKTSNVFIIFLLMKNYFL